MGYKELGWRLPCLADSNNYVLDVGLEHGYLCTAMLHKYPAKIAEI